MKPKREMQKDKADYLLECEKKVFHYLKVFVTSPGRCK